MSHRSSITAGFLSKWMTEKWYSLKNIFSETKIVLFVQTHVINIAGYLKSVLTDRRAFINMLEWE